MTLVGPSVQRSQVNITAATPRRRCAGAHELSRKHDHAAGGHDKPGGGHGKWGMVACCTPMLAIAAAIALSGAGFGFLLIAVMCTAMMVLIMGSVSGGWR